MAFRSAVTLLLSLFGTPLAAQQNPNELLSRVSRKIVETVNRLPKYVCTQTVERKQSAPAAPAGGKSCSELATERKLRRMKLNLLQSDRLRLDVASGPLTEMYSWVGQKSFSDRRLGALVNSGITSTGGFAGFLTVIFGGVDSPESSYMSDAFDEGRRLLEFGFRVPLEHSHYTYRNGELQVKAAYEGTFRLDPRIEDLVQLVFHTGELPPETDACEVTQTVDYGRIRISGNDVLLPTQFQVQVVDRQGDEMDSRSIYSNCHEFLGESTMSFGEPVAPVAATPVNVASAPEAGIPAGLYFRTALAAPINTATAATGDPVEAKVATEIRDRTGKILVPAGSIVNGRIVKMLFSYVPTSNLKTLLTYVPTSKLAVAIRWESIVLGGKVVPFAATPLQSARDRNLNANDVRFRQGDLRRRVELGPTSRSAAGTEPVSDFTFENAKPGYIIRRLDSSWVTGAMP
jgi:hypothetical protein